MKLNSFEVSSFHSVVNSNKINIEELLVLVGKNQAGKSSILQGLEYLSFSSKTNAPDQLTTIDNIKTKFEDESIASRDLPIITANFHLDKIDLEEIAVNLSLHHPVKTKPITPFEEFIVSLMKQAEIEIEVGTKEEVILDEKTGDETSVNIQEYDYTLDPIKLSEIIKKNFENIIIKKFVDGEYSIEINETQYYFDNPQKIVTKIEGLGKKIWGEVHADFDRAPNNQFKEDFNELINLIYYFDYDNLFWDGVSKQFSGFMTKVYDEPLKNKLPKFQQSWNDIQKTISISKLFHPVISSIYKNMPNIFYFDNYQRLEDSLTLSEIKANPDNHETFVNFLKLADIKIDYLEKHKNNVQRLKQYLISNSGEVSKKIQQVYKQEKINFTIEFQNDMIVVFNSYPENPTNLLPPSSGSAGFQWYLGFYINFAVHTNSKYQNAILLLDDPGVLLHPSGHKDLLEEFLRYADKNITIIYSTHLPSLIPKNNFSAIRVVKKENMQTEIIENFWKLDKHDSWSPVRSVLGVDFTDSMIAGSKTLMVEGPADIIYLQGFIEIIKKQTNTEYDLFIIPLEGVTKSNFYITIYTSLKLQFLALVDDDHNYSDMPPDKIIKISVKNKIRTDQISFEIEDLLEPEVIFKSLNILYEDKFSIDLLTELKKNTTKDTLTIIEDFKSKKKIDIKLDKVMLAKTVIRDMRINIKAHPMTLENFEAILTKIQKKLK